MGDLLELPRENRRLNYDERRLMCTCKSFHFFLLEDGSVVCTNCDALMNVLVIKVPPEVPHGSSL